MRTQVTICLLCLKDAIFTSEPLLLSVEVMTPAQMESVPPSESLVLLPVGTALLAGAVLLLSLPPSPYKQKAEVIGAPSRTTC